MIHAGCLPTELLLDRRSPELSVSERSRVQQHLAGCERCRREHRLVLALSALTDQRIESQVVPAAYDRILAEARSRYARGEASAGAALAESRQPRVLTFALGGALACAAVALIFVFAGVRGPKPIASSSSKTSTGATVASQQRDQLIHGELRDGVEILKGGAAIPEGRELGPAGPFVVELAHARLEVAQAKSLSWSARTRVATLLEGVAVVEVDPALRRSFGVLTANFLVNVLGTQFRVDQDTVTVSRGRVQVLARDSLQLLAELGPGQSFTYQAKAAALEAVVPESPGPKGVEPGEEVKGTGPGGEVKGTLPASELLARARRQLSGGQPKQARADIAAALLVTSNRGEQAVAHMLIGDCALVEGNAREAVKKYLEVSRRFSDLAVAETALFSAARIESNSGRKPAARELLQSYLLRYPAGQFRKDADERLRVLEAP